MGVGLALVRKLSMFLVDQGTKAFCSGGDQALRDSDGYVDFDSFGRLNVLDLQVRCVSISDLFTRNAGFLSTFRWFL